MDNFKINGVDVKDMGILVRIFWIFASPFYVLVIASIPLVMGVVMAIAMAVYSPFYIISTFFISKSRS